MDRLDDRAHRACRELGHEYEALAKGGASRFVTRFGLGPEVMQTVLSSEALTDFEAGVESGRYLIGRAQIPAMVALLAGGTLAAMLPVLDGHGTWREIGSDTAELLLTALGVDREEARTLARSELPPLATTT